MPTISTPETHATTGHRAPDVPSLEQLSATARRRYDTLLGALIEHVRRQQVELERLRAWIEDERRARQLSGGER